MLWWLLRSSLWSITGSLEQRMSLSCLGEPWLSRYFSSFLFCHSYLDLLAPLIQSVSQIQIVSQSSTWNETHYFLSCLLIWRFIKIDKKYYKTGNIPLLSPIDANLTWYTTKTVLVSEPHYSSYTRERNLTLVFNIKICIKSKKVICPINVSSSYQN